MILPEALHPAMSRGGFAPYELGVRLGKSSPGDFPSTRTGIWLPQLEVSRAGLNTAATHMGQYASALGTAATLETQSAVASIKGAELDDKTGCWHTNSPALVEDVWTLATHEMGQVLNPKSTATMAALSICDSADCINTRHFDFTFGIGRRQTLYEPTNAFYAALPDGRIRTIWGNVLPSVADSVAKLLDFRLKCPPFASEATSPLTANGISKITIDPNSGCWKVRSYYTAPRGTDNYGRLTLRRHLGLSDDRGSAQMLAHRLLWIVTGKTLKPDRELNHLCGYRACCNPDHIKQVTKETNARHSARMQRAISKMALPGPVVV